MRKKTKASRAPRSEPPQPPPCKPNAHSTDGMSGSYKGGDEEGWKRDRCIRCWKGGGEEEGEGLLVCQERECPIATHAGCLRGEASLDDSGCFYCPFCLYRRQVARVLQLKGEAALAAKNLHLFLQLKPPPPPPRPSSPDATTKGMDDDEEEKEKEEEAGEAAGVCPSPARESSRRRESRVVVGGEKRKRLRWTSEEEDMLKEGVSKFSTSANKNLPWRKILEFGRHVFHPTRTPIDLKDKWRNIAPQ